MVTQSQGLVGTGGIRAEYIMCGSPSECADLRPTFST